MAILLYAFLILLVYFLAGFNKFANFSSTVKGFKNMFLLKNLMSKRVLSADMLKEKGIGRKTKPLI